MCKLQVLFQPFDTPLLNDARRTASHVVFRTDDKAHRLRQECSSKDDTEDSHQRQQVREHRPVVDFLGLAPSAGERGVPLSGVLEALKQVSRAEMHVPA